MIGAMQNLPLIAMKLASRRLQDPENSNRQGVISYFIPHNYPPESRVCSVAWKDAAGVYDFLNPSLLPLTRLLDSGCILDTFDADAGFVPEVVITSQKNGWYVPRSSAHTRVLLRSALGLACRRVMDMLIIL